MATVPIPSGDDARASRSGNPVTHTTRLEIPGRTLVKVVIAALLTLATLWLVLRLGSVLLLILVALLVATVLDQPVTWLERKGVKRGLAALLVLLGLIGLTALLVELMLPAVITETRHFVNELPKTIEGLRATLLRNPDIYNSVTQHLEELRSHPDNLLKRAFRMSIGALTIGFAGVLVLTLALYFLIDGARVRTTLLRLTPASAQTRVDQTLTGMGEAIRGYFVGRSLISLIFAVFMFTLLTVLHVPYAAVFATAAFFFDSIPQVGSLLASILPVTVALSRSVTSAIIVAAAVLVFQQIETNLIAPRVFSGKLKIPPVATLIAVLVGAKLFGIVGALVAIPLAGTLPVLERVWITPQRQAPRLAADPESGPGAGSTARSR